jgi:hypothetical protein
MRFSSGNNPQANRVFMPVFQLADVQHRFAGKFARE